MISPANSRGPYCSESSAYRARRYDASRTSNSALARSVTSPPSRRGRVGPSCDARRTASAGDTRSQMLIVSSVTIFQDPGWAGQPPPEASTTSLRANSSSATPDSRRRNSASPSSAKISDTLLPARASITVSKSSKSHPNRDANFLPTLDFPLAMKPTSKTLSGVSPFAISALAEVRDVGLEVPSDLAHRVPTELLEKRIRHDEGHHGLPNHRCRGNRANVAALYGGVRG